ncbi:patatin-like phospholipase RssA [Alginatibacterium sediminis]|uniref:Patatin-like phospholipase RssA n=1 Tax=Alginatibacterium sediminis TaxID=2164068 RepID=A0A420E8H0_9ALTE|nr:patatin-like phospholipase RssA [Alginatibacterium sediminis]RKF15766.1 patatin-like phospholipase RssA [Alginatibacterium sediminis]
MRRKLKVGLALGSGAARGWAHFGVIEELEKMGIHVDVIAGCSIGSLVGASYAGGQLQDLREWALKLDSWNVFSLMDFALNRGGLVAGEKVFNEAQVFMGATNIENQGKPFAAVATDVESGNEVWLRDGLTRDAVRASCSMPGMFAPKFLNQRWLADGALVNPVPVSLCRALGAEIVIAVNLNADPSRLTVFADADERNAYQEDLETEDHNKEDTPFWRLAGSREYLGKLLQSKTQRDNQPSPGMMAVMSTSINIMQDRITRARMAGDPPDVTISPKLGGFGILDFHRGAECIEAGILATQKAASQLEESVLPFINKEL